MLDNATTPRVKWNIDPIIPLCMEEHIYESANVDCVIGMEASAAFRSVHCISNGNLSNSDSFAGKRVIYFHGRQAFISSVDEGVHIL